MAQASGRQAEGSQERSGGRAPLKGPLLFSRLDRYVAAESLLPFSFGLLLYSTLAVVSMTLPRLQWVVGTPFLELGAWLLLQFPFAIVQTLPVALLLSALLSFGRLASNSELQALQAGGVSRRRIARFFLLLAVVCAGLSLYLNESVLPVTNARVGSLWWELTGGSSGLWRLARQNVPLGDYRLYFERAERASDEIRGVRLESWEDRRLTVIFAERARFADEGLELYNFDLRTLNLAAPLDDSVTAEDALRGLLRVDNRGEKLTVTTSQGVDELVTRHSGGGFEDSRSIREAYRDASDMSLSYQERREASVLFHRKLNEPLANVSLLLVALPLSLLYAKSRAMAFGLSLLGTLAWYLLITLGQLLAQTGVLPVWLGLWGGNLVLMSCGLYLLYVRVNLR